MAPLELASDQVGIDVAGVDVARSQQEAAVEVLGQDLAAGAVELQGMTVEAAADTLVESLLRAGQQDQALLGVAGEVATALGAAPPTPEPQPAPPAPTSPTSGWSPTPTWPWRFP